MKLWGRLSSINVQKVVWCLDELGLRFERVDAGGEYGVVDTPEYRRLNPNGRVPTLDDDGFVLWESNAILRYLAATRSGDVLWPVDPRTRADIDRWMDWQSTTATPGMRDAFWQLIRTDPQHRDPSLVARSAAASEDAAAILDGHLATRQFVAGERFSLADIVLGVHAHRWLSLPLERTPRPNLEAWYARLARRPAARPIFDLPIR